MSMLDQHRRYEHQFYASIVDGVDCPTCHAERGERCKLRGWKDKRAIRPHESRRQKFNRRNIMLMKLNKV